MVEVVVVGALIPFMGLLCLVVLDQGRKYFLQLARDVIELRKHWELTQLEVQQKRFEVEKLERN